MEFEHVEDEEDDEEEEDEDDIELLAKMTNWSVLFSASKFLISFTLNKIRSQLGFSLQRSVEVEQSEEDEEAEKHDEADNEEKVLQEESNLLFEKLLSLISFNLFERTF